MNVTAEGTDTDPTEEQKASKASDILNWSPTKTMHPIRNIVENPKEQKQ